MKEELIDKCMYLVEEKYPDLSDEEVDKLAIELYIKLFESITLKFGELAEPDVLKKLTPLLDEEDEDKLFIGMNEYTDFSKLAEECFEEVRATYLN